LIKKISALSVGMTLLLLSCATYQPPPPTLYITELPLSFVAELSLDERIITEDAWKLLKQGQGKKAGKIIAKLGTQNPFYHVGMGYASLLLNELRAAEEFFKYAQSRYPEMTTIHIGLAQVYEKYGREDQAFAEFREVLKNEPQNSWIRPRYESLKNKKTREAITLGKAFRDSRNAEESKKAYLKALYYSPENSEVHLALADLFTEENNLQNALTHLEAASSIESQNTDIQKQYAEILFLAGENKKSLEIYETLEDRYPSDQEIKKRLEILKNRLGIFELPSQYDAIHASAAVTREGVAALIGVKFKGILSEPAGKPPIIIDIATSWASKYVLNLTSLGILDVYPNHTFRPMKIITRAEMAEVLIRLIDSLRNKGFKFIQHIPPEKIRVSDISPDNYYYQPIIRIISYDIMTLTIEQSFKPDLPVSGQEAIKLLDIILALIQ
jgi:tetratricopeptide (TPR) repeat protein